jgi:hypothetical protein
MGLFAGIQLAGDPSLSWVDLSLVKCTEQSINCLLRWCICR